MKKTDLIGILKNVGPGAVLGTVLTLALAPASFALPLSAYSGTYQLIHAGDEDGADVGSGLDSAECFYNEVLVVENRGNELVLSRTWIQSGDLDTDSPINQMGLEQGQTTNDQIASCATAKGQTTDLGTYAFYCTPGQSTCVKEGSADVHVESVLMQPDGLIYNDGQGDQITYLFSDRIKK